jgi:small subunit ribosomal protein S12e
VLYHARIHFGVAKGIKEVCQALERGEAQLVIMAEDCDHEEYVKLVTALTADKGVYLIKVPEKAKLGDWAGALFRCTRLLHAPRPRTQHAQAHHSTLM